ncbi:hypothetical protein [Enterobacter cloacae complex sp. I8]|uniref:hypothetical protein n=1 Tax=Enterobacter cloacae complex sp. I8 TaxID=2779597 RepID=UPI0018682B4D|nr:hypothetical protein [Enterobacter cloacae complex sp. I8]MBE3541549.1 hypothetical protein [Enterobacter cloacae complex sp. I8]
MSVNRYSVGYKDSASGRYAAMLDQPDGGYVSHEDYAALEQKLAESQREFRAADATIENLQMQDEKLAAENAGLKAAIDATIEWQQSTDPENIESVRMLVDIKTPATDAFLADVMAQGVEMAACALDDVNQFNYANMLDDLAQKLRQEAVQ